LNSNKIVGSIPNYPLFFSTNEVNIF